MFYLVYVANVVNMSQPSVFIGGGLHALIRILGVSLCIAGWQRQNEPSSDFSPRISQKLHLISQKLHLEWLGCSGGCIYLRMPSLVFRKNFGLNGYGPPASPPLPPYQHGTPPEQ